MATTKKIRHILITGSPGVGKTTLIRNVYKNLSKTQEKNANFPICGFYTSEIRCPKTGTRTGFQLITIPDNEFAVLATTNSTETKNRIRQLGKYSVLLDSFEPLVGKFFENSKSSRLLIVDEIGKMECFSKLFCQEVLKLFDRPNGCVLATIPVSTGLPVVETIRSRDDVTLITVTRENRDHLVVELQKLLDSICASNF